MEETGERRTAVVGVGVWACCGAGVCAGGGAGVCGGGGVGVEKSGAREGAVSSKVR